MTLLLVPHTQSKCTSVLLVSTSVLLVNTSEYLWSLDGASLGIAVMGNYLVLAMMGELGQLVMEWAAYRHWLTWEKAPPLFYGQSYRLTVWYWPLRGIYAMPGFDAIQFADYLVRMLNSTTHLRRYLTVGRFMGSFGKFYCCQDVWVVRLGGICSTSWEWFRLLGISHKAIDKFPIH